MVVAIVAVLELVSATVTAAVVVGPAAAVAEVAELVAVGLVGIAAAVVAVEIEETVVVAGALVAELGESAAAIG